MAVGDKAAAAGLTTYSASQDRRLGYENDNRNADYIAGLMDRLKALETQVIGTPVYSVAKSSNGQSLQHDTAAVFGAGAWGKSIKNVGGFTFSGGALTVPRSGIYGVQAVMKPAADDFYATFVAISRNNSNPTTPDMIARSVTYPGDQGSYNNPNVSPTNTASRLLVALNAGDVLRVVGYQRNFQGQTVGLDDGETSLTFEVQWKAELDAS
jgi:hypothetical protein